MSFIAVLTKKRVVVGGYDQCRADQPAVDPVWFAKPPEARLNISALRTLRSKPPPKTTGWWSNSYRAQFFVSQPTNLITGRVSIATTSA